MTPPLPLHLLAGMPSFRLTDVAASRLDAISFFLVVYVLCAVAFMLVWNWLAKDLAFLPRIGFRKAIGLLVVFGLFACLILTMISGARELMTPGAWARKPGGNTYELLPPEQHAKAWTDSSRIKALERLRDELWAWAAAHENQLPADRWLPTIPPAAWAGISPDGEPYAYEGNLPRDGEPRVLAWEPAPYGPTRFALLTSGEVARMTLAELKTRLEKERENRFAEKS